MSTDRWTRLSDWHNAWLAADAAGRRKLRFELASQSPDLVADAEALVGVSASMAGFLETPAFLVTAAQLASDAVDLPPGTLVGPYRIAGLIARGGMGIVYRATDTRLDRLVALKMLAPIEAPDDLRVERFLREARITASLDHPNIVKVFDVGTHRAVPFMVGELLEGQTLRQTLDAGPIAEPQARRIAAEIAAGLVAAGAAGLVHRDLKPDNVFLTRAGVTKILDFGIAKLAPDAMRRRSATSTLTGILLGTAGYLAPEQIQGKDVDGRADLFALGAILFEMLTGQRAFAGENTVDTLHAILHDPPPDLIRPRGDVSASLEALVSRLLEKAPHDRFQTAAEVVWALERSGERPGERRVPSARALDAERPGAASPRGARDQGRFIRRSLAAKRLAAIAGLGVIVLAGLVLVRHFRPPVVVERDSVVVAEIVNETGDAVFDGTVKQALLIQLEPSPFLSIVSESAVRQALRMMGRSADDRLTPGVAREVCQREGAKVVLTGSLAALGSRYVINLSAADCASGDAFAREQEEADRKETVVAALARATTRLRAQLGESLSSVERFHPPFERATTPSLEALKTFTQAATARARGADVQAIEFLNRALELDPNFPMAHIRLSGIFSTAAEFERAAQHARQAFDKKDLVGERERLGIEYAYYKRVTGQIDRAIATLDVFRQTYPRDPEPTQNLSNIHAQTGDYEAAAREALESIRLKGSRAQATAALARARLGLKQFDEARQLSETGSAATLSVAQRGFLYYLGFMNEDETSMQQQVQSTAGTSGEPYVRIWHAHALAARGRFGESREQFRLTVAAAQRVGLPELAATVEALQAIGEAAAGNLLDARRIARASVGRAFGRHATSLAAVALALSGATDQADALAVRLRETYPLDTLLTNVWLPCARAVIAAQRGRAHEGLEILRAAAPYEWGWTSYYLPAYIRGLLYLQTHNGANARAQFQNILDHQGVLPVSPLYTLAALQVGRAAVMSTDTPAALRAYERFLSAWKNADAEGQRLLDSARAEYRLLPRAIKGS